MSLHLHPFPDDVGLQGGTRPFSKISDVGGLVRLADLFVEPG